MRNGVIVVCAAGLALSGCSRISESRFNPLNWFGAARSEAVVTAPASLIPERGGRVTVDQRGAIDQIVGVELSRTISGGLLTATGVDQSVGGFNAELVLISREAGTLTYEMRIERSGQDAGTTGSPAARTTTAAVVLSAQDLAGVRRITVQGASSAMSVTR